MDIQTQRALVALTNRFYREHARDFSRTRRTAWPGWVRCARLIEDAFPARAAEAPAGRVGPNPAAPTIADPGNAPLRVLDIGSGNLRFERFLAEALGDRPLAFRTVDNCPSLLPDAMPAADIAHSELDVIGAAVEGRDPLADAGLPPCDVAVCFGLMHHVPDAAARDVLLRTLVRAVRPGGLAIVSLWRFMDVPSLAEGAGRALVRAQADPTLDPRLRGRLDGLAHDGDLLLGWQHDEHAWRYCHSFSDADVGELVAGARGLARPLARFRADGRDGRTNEYLVLRRIGN